MYPFSSLDRYREKVNLAVISSDVFNSSVSCGFASVLYWRCAYIPCIGRYRAFPGLVLEFV